MLIKVLSLRLIQPYPRHFKLDYKIKSKATYYKGVAFRSRLEAQWAAFFDFTGWEWNYEPSEINGFNPDFIIRCRSNSYDTNIIIVEVKPEVLLNEEERNIIYNKYYTVKAHILILTDMPFSKTNTGLLSIGLGSQYFPDRLQSVKPELYDFEMKTDNDFGSSYMGFDGMIYGKVERKQFLSVNYECEPVIRKWLQAGNTVRFKVKAKL